MPGNVKKLAQINIVEINVCKCCKMPVNVIEIIYRQIKNIIKVELLETIKD